MPQGKGTYGSKKGRPPKTKSMGYASGGMKATSAKGKKEPMLDKKKMKGKKPAAAIVIAKNKGGSMKAVPAGSKGLSKLPKTVRNKMGYMAYGGMMGKKSGKKK